MIERCEYCGSEERYGHTAVCVMNEVLELRAKNERLRSELELIRAKLECGKADAMKARDFGNITVAYLIDAELLTIRALSSGERHG